jgi:hypothetical protein
LHSHHAVFSEWLSSGSAGLVHVCRIPSTRAGIGGVQSRFLMGVAVAAFMFAFVLALTAGAQETTDENAGGAATDTQQPQVFAEGEQTAQAQADAEQPGPLAGTEVETLSTAPDPEVETITIPRTDCTFEQRASFVLQDDDGTQADFIDNVNVKIRVVDAGLEVVSNDPGRDGDIVPLNERGGDKVLDTGGLVIVTSTGIACAASTPPPSSPPPNSPPPNSAPPSSPPSSSTPPSTPPPGSASPEPEPQDVEKGPLAGGTAIGKDVLVPGDVIDILPDGTRVNGIDQIIIETENCQLTAQGDELTITMSDRGVPFRIRDVDNADITLEADGTIVANGRSTLGQSFPEAVRENPDKLIVPIPVDPENDQFPRGPNDTFPIISSTGIGGDGCRVVGDSTDGGGDAGNVDRNASIDDAKTNAGDVNSKEGVIPDTISENPVPNTGGMSMLGPVVSGLAFIGVGLLLFRSAVRRNT